MDKSTYEEKTIDFLKEDIDNHAFVPKSLYNNLGFLAEKLLGVCEELRVSKSIWKERHDNFKSSEVSRLRESRDSWKEKYMDLKNGINQSPKHT